MKKKGKKLNSELYRQKRARAVMDALQGLDTAKFIKLLNSFTMKKGIKLRRTDLSTIRSYLDLMLSDAGEGKRQARKLRGSLSRKPVSTGISYSLWEV